MGWQCPACTLINSNADSCCEVCKCRAPAAVKRAAGSEGSWPQQQQQEQQQAQDIEVIDLVDDDEQQRSSDGMGNGASKELLQEDESKWETWDEDFQIELSDSPAAVTSPAQQRQPPASAQGEHLWRPGCARGSSKAPATKRKRLDGREEHAGAQAPLDEQGSGSSAETAVAAQVALPSNETGRAEAGEQQERQPPEQQPREQLWQAEVIIAGKRARGAEQAQAAGSQAAAPLPPLGSLSRAVQRQPDAALSAAAAHSAQSSELLRKRKRDLGLLLSPQPSSSAQPAEQGVTRQPATQPPPACQRATPAASALAARREPQATPVAAALSAHKPTPCTAAEVMQPRLPKQASLRLPPRRSPVDKQLSASPPSAGPTAGSVATPSGPTSKQAQPPAAQQASPHSATASDLLSHQLLPKAVALPRWRPPLPPTAGMKSSSALGVLQGGQGATAAMAEQGTGGVQGPTGRQRGVPSSSRPEDWQLSLAAFHALALNSTQPEGSQQQAQPAAGQPTPQDVRQPQAARQRATQPPPAWVQRAKQGALDLSPAVLHAAGECQPAGQEQWAGQASHAAVPGWFAYRVAAQLPAARSCSSACDLLHAAAGALQASPAEALGATLHPGSTAGAGTSSEGRQPQAMTWGQVTARLLAAASDHGPQLGLADRCERFHEQPASGSSEDLWERLAAVLAAEPLPNATAARAGKRSKADLLPRLGEPHEWADDAAGAGGGGSGDGSGAAAAQPTRVSTIYRGVRCATGRGGSKRYHSNVCMNSGQVSLGVYGTIEAGARAVDLAHAYYWLSGGRRSAEPAFNLPHSNYLQDDDLVRELTALSDVKALKEHVKRVCGATNYRGQRLTAR